MPLSMSYATASEGGGTVNARDREALLLPTSQCIPLAPKITGVLPIYRDIGVLPSGG
jgi:hypothetical protein